MSLSLLKLFDLTYRTPFSSGRRFNNQMHALFHDHQIHAVSLELQKSINHKMFLKFQELSGYMIYIFEIRESEFFKKQISVFSVFFEVRDTFFSKSFVSR